MSEAKALLDSLSEHTHSMSDSDIYFQINPVTREISSHITGKKIMMQYDHNSEIFTFEIPRYVDGHDMLKCNRVLVHWDNVSEFTIDKTCDSTDIYDLQINPDNESTVICTWTVGRESTQFAGTLSFLVQYMCIEDGVITYEWYSDIFSDIEIKPGRQNGEPSLVKYPDGTIEGTALILKSSTTDSVKRFKITVNDSGELTATELT